MNKLFCFGYGYSAATLAKHLLARGEWRVAGTTRSSSKMQSMELQGIDAYQLYDVEPSVMLGGATHILISIPPDAEGCPVFADCRAAIQTMTNLQWLGYCSTTGVYGDAGGAWVNENTPVNPLDERSDYRVKAEKQWLSLVDDLHIPAHIFRLSGIYGPERSVIERLQKEGARRIVKEDHYFSRIYVEDIARILYASIEQPQAGEIYNLADDYPCPSHEVVEYASKLLGVSPPQAEEYDAAEMSGMMKSFYAANKRVANDKTKETLGVKLAYPTYREGLKAII